MAVGWQPLGLLGEALVTVARCAAIGSAWNLISKTSHGATTTRSQELIMKDDYA